MASLADRRKFRRFRNALLTREPVRKRKRLVRPIVIVAADSLPEPRYSRSLISPKRVASSRRVIAQVNAMRVACSDCDMVSAPGPMGRHFRKTGHHRAEATNK